MSTKSTKTATAKPAATSKKAPAAKAPKAADMAGTHEAPEATASSETSASEPKVETPKAEKAPVVLPTITTVTAVRVAGAEDGRESKAVKKIVVVPEVTGADGQLDRQAMRAYIEVVFGVEVAKAARWYPIATAQRSDVAVDVKTGDPKARPGFLVNRGMIESRLPGLGIDKPESTMAVVIA